MATIIQYGPQIPTTGTIKLPAWQKTTFWSDSVRRKKPEGIDEILRLTAHNKHDWFLTRGIYRTTNTLTGAAAYGPSPYVCDPSKYVATVPNGQLAALAWAKLLEQLQAQRFDTATFIGELPETVHWIAESAKDMMKAYQAIKRGRWVEYLPSRKVAKGRKGRKYIRVRGPRYQVFTFKRRDGSTYNARLSLDGRLAKRYLEWRFAVQPLVSEVGNLMDAYYEQALNPIISRAQGSESTVVPLVFTDHKGYRREYVRACAYYTITTSAKALQKWGGFNVLGTLWNLTPLSFMVDRFIPIGQFLGNLDAEMGVTWKSFYTMMRYRFEGVSTAPKVPNGSYSVSTVYGSGYIRTLTKHTGMDLNVSLARVNFQTALDLLALTRSIGESLLKKR